METQTQHSDNNNDNGVVNLPVPVSSASSLDSFLVGLPSNAALASLAEIPDVTDSGVNLASDTLLSAQGEIVDSQIQPLSAGDAAAMTQKTTARPRGITGLPKPTTTNNNTSPLLAVGDNILLPGVPNNNTVPEFLYQLTRMLTDDNRDTIEWSNGMIEVHSPHRLEAQVLHKYFRHSKFASFQRQLNYFGFRKKSGKGKMAPCSYVNQSVTGDLASLLLIKRKTTTSTSGTASHKDGKGTKNKAATSKRKISNGDLPASRAEGSSSPVVNPILAGILQQSTLPAPASLPALSTAEARGVSGSQVALARSAVGKGIRYSYLRVNNPLESTSVGTAVAATTATTTSQQPGERLLSQLESNYRSCIGTTSTSEVVVDTDPTPLSEMREEAPFAGYLRPSSSLVDLAMIPTVEETNAASAADTQGDQLATVHPGAGIDMDSSNHNNNNADVGLTFVDFPYPEVYPAAIGSEQQGVANDTTTAADNNKTV